MALDIKPFGPKMARFCYRDPALDARINILEGAVRSSKTWGLHPKTIRLCQYDVAGDGLFTGVSKTTIYRNVLSDLFSMIGRKNYSYNRSSGQLRLFNTNWWVVGASDEGSEKTIQGLTLGRVIGDELTNLPRTYWQMLLTRMSPEGARLYGTCNPKDPFHYLKTDYLDNAEMRAEGTLWSEHFTLDDNPTLTEEYKEFLRSSFSGVFYLRYILGQWVIAEGSIYRDCLGPQSKYNDATRPPHILTSYGARYIPVDYGTANPCVFLDVYDDGKTFWQENEYYWDSRKMAQQKTDAEYGDDFEKFVGPDRRGVIAIVDPSAASFKTELVRRGFQVKNAVNDVEPGIRRTSSALKVGLYKIHERCVNTLREMPSYAWNEKKLDKGADDEPIKKNDHTCDAVRYCVFTMMPARRIG